MGNGYLAAFVFIGSAFKVQGLAAISMAGNFWVEKLLY